MRTGTGSPFAPLRHRAFRQLWLGAMCLHISLWMQMVTAGWLMVSLNGSALEVGLVQTASTLPMFLLALPSGVLADLVNRRHFLSVSQVSLGAIALLTAIMVSLGFVTPWVLLALTFLYGVGNAVQGPAWFTTQIDVIPAHLRLAAVSLGSASFSSARAVGPALAGLLMAWVSPALVFGFIALLSFTSVLLLQQVAQVPHQRGPDAPVENFGIALANALRYAWSNRRLQIYLLRTFVFVLPGAALWALLPLVALGDGGSAGAYGLLLGFMGVGAIVGALTVSALHSRWTKNQIESFATIVFGLACVIASQTAALLWLGPSLFAAGVAWAWINNLGVTAIQMEAQPEMRSRALAIFLIVFQGAMACGGWLWGAAAAYFGLTAALLIASTCIGLAIPVYQLTSQTGQAD